MKLTWKDATSTVLAGAAVLIAFAVTDAWAWPLLGDYRAGTIALAVVGIGMCATGTSMAKASWSDPLVLIASFLGVLALVFIVAGLFMATVIPFVALAVDIVALWFVSTLRHLIDGVPEVPAHPQAA
jgi:hypothetical protein